VDPDRFEEALMRPLLLCSLTFAALTAASPVGAGKKPADPQTARDEDALRTAGLGTDDAALLRFFRSRTLSLQQQQQFRRLVKQLGSPSYTQRVKATEALVKMGPQVKGLLLEVKKEAPNSETVRRTELCLGKLDAGKEPQYAEAAA